MPYAYIPVGHSQAHLQAIVHMQLLRAVVVVAEHSQSHMAAVHKCTCDHWRARVAAVLSQVHTVAVYTLPHVIGVIHT